MFKSATSAAFGACLATALPAAAGITGVTADGTWDCLDQAGAPVGAIVVADTSYAFIKADGRVGAYGKLHQVAEADLDLPAFVVLSGHLKDEMGVTGVVMRGPEGHIDDYSGELFLNVIITEANMLQCARRKDPAA